MNKILLLNLNWSESGELGAMSDSGKALPLEFVYISTNLISRNIDHEFVDCWCNNLSMIDIQSKIKEAQFVILCSSPSYLFWRDGVININFVSKTINKIKEINPETTTILIGPHGSVLPKDFNSTKLDYIFKGEPDYLVPQYIKNLINKNEIALPGMVKKINGDFSYNTDKGFEVLDLGKNPPLNYSKFNLEMYKHPPVYGKMEANKNATIYEASRGCPFNCIFCFKIGFRDKYRKKPLELIDIELNELANRNIGYVYLIDEIMFMDKKWAIEVMKLLKKHNILWGCQTRPSLLTEELVSEILKYKFGGLIQIGLEHTNSEVLKAMNKAETDIRMLAKQLVRLTDANIFIDLFVVTGLPGDSKQRLMEMGKTFNQFPMDKINPIVHTSIPLPGTQLWQLGKESGYDLNNWDDINKYTGIIKSSFKTSKDIETASFALTGLIRSIQDKQRICNNKGNFFLYIKFLKHTLDRYFPSFMYKVTNFKQKTK